MELGVGHTVGVENELIRGGEKAAIRTSDALGPGAVVSRWDEGALAAPGALVVHLEGEILRQFRWTVLGQKGLAQSLSLPFVDHAATAGGDRHGVGSPENLQLDRGALDAGDAQGNPAVVDLVVAELLEEGVGDLGQAESLLVVYNEGGNLDAEQVDHVALVVAVGALWLRGHGWGAAVFPHAVWMTRAGGFVWSLARCVLHDEHKLLARKVTK